MLTISSVAVSPMPPQAPTVVRVQPMTPTRVSDNVSPENQGVAAPVAPAGEGSRAQAAFAPSSLPPVNPSGEVPRANHFNNPATPERIGEAMAITAVLTQAAVAQAVRSRAAGASENALVAQSANPAAANANLAQDPQAASANLAQDPQAANTTDSAAQQPTAEQQAQAQYAPRAASDQMRFRGELPVEVKNPAIQALDDKINHLLPNMWGASRAAVDMLIGDEARAAAAARAEVLSVPSSVSPERAGEVAENYNRTSNLPEPQMAGRNVNRLV